MKKGKIVRAALAMGMAAVLTAVPVSAFAESADDVDLMAGLEEMSWEYDGAPVEGGVDVAFGNGLYQMAGEGQDLSWLKDVSTYGKLVPGEESVDGEASVELNGSRICQVLGSYEPASGMIYLSAPDYFDQAVAINPKTFVQNMTSGSNADGGAYSMLSQMVMQAVMKIAGDLQEFYRSIPQEEWQEELMSYLTPVMKHLVQETSQETMTVAGLSADVTVQTISLPSDKMSEVISSLLESASNDKIVEAFLQSDAVSGLCSFVSMVSGGTVSISGQQILDQMKAALDSASKADFSQIPGVVIKVMNNEDRSAAGYTVSFEMGGQISELYTVKAIQKGEEHAFEIIPSAAFLSMYGINASGAVDILGKGSTAGGKLNHETNVSLDDKSVLKFTITDLDLETLELTGNMIGKIHAEFGGMSLDVNYDTKDDGTRTIEYLVNGEVFYNASAWGRPTEDTTIDQIDKDNALQIESVDDLTGWIRTFHSEALTDAFRQAGVPMGSVAA